MREMDEAAARRAWEEIRRALSSLPTKPLREAIAESWGGKRPLSVGILLARWPSLGEALDVVSARSDDLRLVAAARMDENRGLWLTFQTEDPDLAKRTVYFVVYTPKGTDEGPLASGGVLMAPTPSNPNRFEGRCRLGTLEGLRPSDILVIRFAVAP